MFSQIFSFFARSLRGRLTLLVAAVMLPAIGLAVVLIRQAYTRERAALARQTEGTAQALRLVVEGVLQEKEALLKGLATSRSLQNGDMADFYRQARELVPGPGEWIVLIDADRRQLINTYLPLGTPLPAIHFRDDFRQAALAGRTYVSNLTLGPASNRWVVFIAIPILQNGQLRYTLNLAMRPRALALAVLRHGFGVGRTVSIVDRDARIIVRNRGGEKYIGRQATGPLLAAMRERSEGWLASVTLDGIPTISAFSRSQTIGWSVIIGAPRAELYASAQELLWWIAGASLVLGIVTIAMAWWVSGGVLRGVRSLVADVGKLARAEPLGAASTGMDDTDVVASALRESAEKLQARESELRQLNDTLETRVQIRTRALAEANRDLEEFARIASHDLKEPLRLISAFANLLQTEHQEQLDETARSYVERIDAAAERMRALVRDILTYSRASALPTQMKEVDLNRMLDSVLAGMEVTLNETGARVEAGELAKVRGDPVQMEQLLANLVGNAVKFRRAGVPPVVRVHTENGGEQVRLVVEDNGIGFDARYTERIFAPFERLHAHSRYEGTGIGLAIVRRIAERHAGHVRATSVPGEGSRFEVTLPAVDGTAI